MSPDAHSRPRRPLKSGDAALTASPWRRPVACAAALLTVAGVLVGYGATGPRTAQIDLYTEGVALDSDGDVLAVPTGTTAELLPGSRVVDDGTTAADDLAAEQRAWLAAGDVPGADGPYADMVGDALLDLHTLLLDDGASVAAWTPHWRYVWPRDASFVAVALARTGHRADAVEILDFLAEVQEPDGSFQARYLPDGSGVPDDRGTQTDGTGWVLWASAEVVAAAQEDDGTEAALAAARHLRPLVDRATAGARRLVAGDGLPPASPDYWEVPEDALTLGTVAPVLAGLEGADRFYTVLGDTDAARQAAEAADRTRAAVHEEFGDEAAYGRYAGRAQADAASAFTLRPFQPEPLPGAVEAWLASSEAMARPAGGLAPGAGWRQDGVSWTPQTSLYALTAASNGRTDEARAWLDWLDTHRTATGALPEKVLADGSPAAVAPLAWTAACVVLAVDELDRA